MTSSISQNQNKNFNAEILANTYNIHKNINTDIINKSFHQTNNQTSNNIKYDKPEVIQMKAIINQFQFKLDQKVNQVIHDIINHSKKNDQDLKRQLKQKQKQKMYINGNGNSSGNNGSLVLPEITKTTSLHHYHHQHRKSDSINLLPSSINNAENSFLYNSGLNKSINEKKRMLMINTKMNGNHLGRDKIASMHQYQYQQSNQNKTFDQGYFSVANNVTNISNSYRKNLGTSFINKNQYQDIRQIQQIKTRTIAALSEKDKLGRSMGKQVYKKPKPLKRQVEVLSKQMRWNPFCEKNAIKVHQLDQGMLSLIQKGKIGKDVDIITAFEKGRPVLDMKPAIFHHAEQKFNQQIQTKIKLPKHLRQKLQSDLSVNMNNNQNNQNAWAITAPPEDQIDIQSKQKQKTLFLKQKIDISFQTSLFLKFLHYKIVQDEKFHQLRKQKFQEWVCIKMILQKVSQFLKKYTHEIVYVDSNKIVKLALMVRKPNQFQIMQCIVLPKGKNPKQELKSIKCIKNVQKKKQTALMMIKSIMKANLIRLRYLKGLKKRKIQHQIVQWAVNSIIMKNYKRNVVQKRKQIQEKFTYIQGKFRQEYQQILNKKHYQIHIPNKHNFSHQKFRQILNSDIVRIFNLNNPNTHIIYLCPFQMSQDTASYYYKIMQLQEIENFKDRVTFMQVDSQKQFPFKMSISQKLYYSSKTLRKLQKKIKDHLSYFVTSYPSDVDIKLSAFMNIPIFSGNLLELKTLQKRSLLAKNFKESNVLNMLVLNGGINSIFQISNQIIRFCDSFKNIQKFIIKLNDHYQSSGVGLLAYPFTSLPQMFSKTTLISEKYKTIDSFYLKLARNGGIIQKYDQNITPITVIGKIDLIGQSQIIGTFQKISYGFMNVGYLFPQRVIPHRMLLEQSNKVINKLCQKGHFGQFEITFFVDRNNKLYLQKVQSYFTRIGSSLYYFKFLSGGEFNSLGQFMTKIYQNYQGQDQLQSQMPLQQPRGYCFIPYLLHFGLSEKQSSSFFQLCRMGGVSFDLQNKYGSTFILLGNLKSSLGIITTAKDRKNIIKLMLNSLDFLIKQNSHNVSNQMLKQKEIILRERTNINAIKDLLEQYL